SSSPARLPRAIPLFPYTTLSRSSIKGRIVRDRLPRRRTGRSARHTLFQQYRHRPDTTHLPPYSQLSTAAKRSGCRHGAKTLTARSEEHTSELQSRENLVCRLLLE